MFLLPKEDLCPRRQYLGNTRQATCRRSQQLQGRCEPNVSNHARSKPPKKKEKQEAFAPKISRESSHMTVSTICVKKFISFVLHCLKKMQRPKQA